MSKRKGIPDNLCLWCRKRISKGDEATKRAEMRRMGGLKAPLHLKCVKAWDDLSVRHGALIR